LSDWSIIINFVDSGATEECGTRGGVDIDRHCESRCRIESGMHFKAKFNNRCEIE